MFLFIIYCILNAIFLCTNYRVLYNYIILLYNYIHFKDFGDKYTKQKNVGYSRVVHLVSNSIQYSIGNIVFRNHVCILRNFFILNVIGLVQIYNITFQSCVWRKRNRYFSYLLREYWKSMRFEMFAAFLQRKDLSNSIEEERFWEDQRNCLEWK